MIELLSTTGLGSCTLIALALTAILTLGRERKEP